MASTVNVHEDLNKILDYQTHRKLQETQDRGHAKNLNDHVFFLSIGQIVVTLFIGVIQVLVLRFFFWKFNKWTVVLLFIFVAYYLYQYLI